MRFLLTSSTFVGSTAYSVVDGAPLQQKSNHILVGVTLTK